MSVRRQGQLYIVLAAVAWSTAGVLQRELTVDTATQVAGRALFALFALAAFVVVTSRGRPVEAFRSMGMAGLAVAGCTAVASGTFIVALNHATVANVLFMQAVAPIAAALLAWLALRRVDHAALGGRDGRGRPRRRLHGRRPRHRRALRHRGIVRDDARLRGGDRHHAAPARHLDGPGDLPVAARRPRVAAPFASPGTITQHDLVFLILLGVGQMGLGLAFLTWARA